MKRIVFAIALMVAALVIFGSRIQISTAPDAIFPDAQIETPSLDDVASREVIVTLSHPDLQTRNAVARSLAANLATDPLVENIKFAASMPSEEFQNWVWDSRFQLAPPQAADFDSVQVVLQLKEAMEYFSNVNSMIHGDRFLLDPTGSYRRLVQSLERRGADILTEQNGVWQSADQSAAVLHLRLTNRPFDAAEVQALATSIRTLSAKEGVIAHILGVRIIAAETTLFNTAASTRASLLAAVLLLCWLIWSLRSITAALYAFLPVSLGLTAAFISVTLIFGAVHIVALAFGGVLLGLALDYPIHVMGHPVRLRPKAHHLIFLGAVTTGIAFLAMVGSQLPALVQTGVFILIGLSVSAMVAILVPNPATVNVRGLCLHRYYFRLPAKAAIEYALAALGVVTILGFSAEAPITLFEPPQHIRSEIREMAVKLNLPSSKYAIDVRGDTLAALLEHEDKLAAKLDREIEKGTLLSYKMLTQLLPSNKPALVNPSAFHASARAALAELDMSIEYSKQQLLAYEQAIQSPAINQQDLARFPETADLARRIRISANGWHERVQITLPIGAAQPDFAINLPDAEMVDLLAPIQRSMTDLKANISLWLLVGLICGLGVLALGLKSSSQTLRIFRTSSAVLGASVCLLIVLYGSLSLFHIVALALVLGIGVDYSIILAGLKSEGGSADTSATSVFVCAISTLIAFAVLAFSQVQILHQIGLTVVIGLLLMLFLTLAQSGNIKE